MKVQLALTPQEQLVFLKDLDEHLLQSENALVELEHGNDESGSIEQLFRSFHTIKGNSSIADYTILHDLTHEIESVLSVFRAKKRQVSAELIRILFKAIDLMRSLRAPILSPKTEIEAEPVESLIREAKRFLSKPEPSESTSSTHHELEKDPHLQNNMSIYINLTEPMPAVRGFQILQLIEKSKIDYTSEPSFNEIKTGNIQNPINIQLSQTGLAEFIKTLIPDLSTYDGVKAIHIQYPQPNNPNKAKPKSLSEAITQDTEEELQEIQINIRKLDGLINLLGEILIDRNKISQNILRLEEKYSLDPHVMELLDLVNHLGKITYNLQTELLNIRTIPLNNIVEKYPRLIRELGHQLGKKVKLEITGQHVELDRLILKHLNELIIHLIRNSVDHGIESPEVRLERGKSELGTIRIDAHQKHNKAHFVISDDGNGIDPNSIRESLIRKNILDKAEAQRTSDQEIVRYIFYPGFSTKDEVSEISGRGVGMDIVQNTIQKLGGQISIESEKGTGTSFRITLPLTLAIIHGLVTQVNKKTFVIPINYVEEVLRCRGEDVRIMNNKPHIILRDTLIPLVNLTALLYGNNIDIAKSGKLFIVIVVYNDKPTGIVVDKLLGEEEIVIKNIDYAADKYYIIHSATIMGTGDVGLILDIASLLDYLTMHREESARIIVSDTNHENTHR